MTKIKELSSHVVNMYLELNKSLGMDIMDKPINKLHAVDTEIMLRINSKLDDLINTLEGTAVPEPEASKYKIKLDFSEALEDIKEFKDEVKKDNLQEQVDKLNSIIKPFYDSIGEDYKVDIDKVRQQVSSYNLQQLPKEYNINSLKGVEVRVNSDTFSEIVVLANKGMSVRGSTEEPIRERVSVPLTRVLEYKGIVFVEEVK